MKVDEWDIAEGALPLFEVVPDNATDAPLNYPGVSFTPSGLMLPPNLPFDRWQRIVETLPRIGDAVKWAVGDALNYGEARYGEKYSQAMDSTGLEYQSLNQRRWVAKSFTFIRRRINVPWWVYVEIAAKGEGEQERLLDEYEGAYPKPKREEFRVMLRDPLSSPPLEFHHNPPGLSLGDGGPALRETTTIVVPSHFNEHVIRGAMNALSDVHGHKAQEAAIELIKSVSKNTSGEVDTARMEKAVKVLTGQTTNIHVSDDSYEWYTPDVYIEAARRAMGGIDIDPATSVEAQKKVQAGAFFTKDDDGLSKPWQGRVWLNPPYSSPDVDNFVSKAVDEYAAGNATAAVILTNNSTDTRWFHRAAAAASALCFTKGRLEFWNPNVPTLAARQGQVFIYLGSDPQAFAREFRAFGLVVVPHAD